MYTPYLMFAYAVALVLALLGFGVIHRSTPGLRGLNYLRRYVLCDLSAALLLGLRMRAPLLVSEVVPNLLLFIGVVFLYCATTEILEVRPRLLWWAAGCCAAAGPVMVWLTYVRYSELYRLEAHCGVLIAVLAMSAITLFIEARPDLRDPARACAWLLTAGVAVNTAWGIYGLIGRPNFLHPDAIHAAFSYLAMMLTLSNVIALGWLSFSAHREHLEATAHTDALTGLLNRGAFEELLLQELNHGGRWHREFSVILIDIDYFKQVNDEHGHLVGDDVLRRIGHTLRAGIRPSDIVGRFGGEEFVILLRESGLGAAEEVAERLRVDIAALGNLPREITLTASFGVAARAPHETVSELLSRADEALYRSKREGRNQVRVHDEVCEIRHSMAVTHSQFLISHH